LHSSLPTKFLSSIEGVTGFDAAGFEAVHASGEQVVSVRLNPAKWPGGGIARAGENVNGAGMRTSAGAVRYGRVMERRVCGWKKCPGLHGAII